jgi:hypothetical protein
MQNELKISLVWSILAEAQKTMEEPLSESISSPIENRKQRIR